MKDFKSFEVLNLKSLKVLNLESLNKTSRSSHKKRGAFIFIFQHEISQKSIKKIEGIKYLHEQQQ